MAVRDPKTEKMRVGIYRQMPPEQKMLIAAQIYEDAIANMRSAIYDRYPDFTEEEIRCELRRRILPRRLFREVEAHLGERRQ